MSVEAVGPQSWVEWLTEIPRAFVATVVALTLGGIWIRYGYLNGPMGYDEAYTVVVYAIDPPFEIVRDYSLPNNHILHTLLVHMAIRLGGLDPWVVRMPAFVAGVVLIPAAFLVFARLAGHLAGVVSAFLVGGSSILIAFSVNARGYTLAAVLALACVALVSEIRLSRPRAWQLLALGATGAIGLWTTPVFIYSWAAILVWLLAPDGRRPWRARLSNSTIAGGLSAGGATLLYLPVIANDGLAAITSNRFVTPDPFDLFLEAMPGFFQAVASMWVQDVPVVVVGLVVLGSIVALTSSRAGGVRSLAWSMVIAVSSILLMQHVVPFPRVWLVLLPMWIGVAAAGLAVLADGWRPAGLVPRGLVIAGVALMAASLWISASTSSAAVYPRGSGDAELITLELDSLVNSATYVASSRVPQLHYYFQLHGLPARALESQRAPPEQIYVVTRWDQTVEEILILSGYEGVAARAIMISDYPSLQLWVVPPPY